MKRRALGPALRNSIRKRLRDVLEACPRALASGRKKKLHRVRIDVKRLRYNLEFAAPLAPSDASAALEMLALLQDSLGAVADADTFARTYRELHNPIDQSDDRHAGLQALTEVAERERERALAAVRALWTGEGRTYAERLSASISPVLDALSCEEGPRGDVEP